MAFYRSWRMNPRMYGILEGCDKSKLAFHHGNEQIMAWTREFDIAPPPLSRNSREHPVFENKYEVGFLFSKYRILQNNFQLGLDIDKNKITIWHKLDKF